jgi:predicted  nucleic acid-binding Zn-ribbon protein
MSKDLTQKLNGSLEDKVDRLITIVQSMDSRIESIGSRIESMESRIESIESRIESIESRIDSIDLRLSGVEDRLGSLEAKVEERLKDTRPMWEIVQTQLASLRESQDRLRGEMEKGFRLVDRRLENQPVEYDKLYRYHRDLEERVEKIEKQLS